MLGPRAAASPCSACCSRRWLLAGSLFVQLYVFFAWLEERALAQVARPPHRAGAGQVRRAGPSASSARTSGRLPRVPWVLAAIFVFLPLAVLTQLAPKCAALLIVLLVLAPILYARFDR